MAGAAQDYIKYLMSKGLSRNAATAAIARFIQESSLNPSIKGDKSIPGASIGLGQWNRERQANLRAFGGENWLDPYKQLDFFLHEGRGTPGIEGLGAFSEQSAYNRLVNAQSQEDAVGAMMDYERPQGWAAGNSAGGHGYRNTLNNYSNLMGGANPGEQYNLARANDPRNDTPSSAHPIGSELPGAMQQPGMGGSDMGGMVTGATSPSPGYQPGEGGAAGATAGMEAVAKAQKKFDWDKFGEGISGMGGGGAAGGGSAMPASPQASLAPTASGGIDPQESEIRRQRLAEAMAKLNSGKLW